MLFAVAVIFVASVAVAAKAIAILVVPSKDVPPIVLAVAKAVAGLALPSKVAVIVPAVPETTSLLIVASGIKVNLLVESS